MCVCKYSYQQEQKSQNQNTCKVFDICDSRGDLMASSTKASTEPFVRVRLIHFNDGKSLKSLEHLRLKIDTVDSQQSNRSMIENRIFVSMIFSSE